MKLVPDMRNYMSAPLRIPTLNHPSKLSCPQRAPYYRLFWLHLLSFMFLATVMAYDPREIIRFNSGVKNRSSYYKLYLYYSNFNTNI